MSQEGELTKRAPRRRTEAFYRQRIRESVRGRYKDANVPLSGEAIGLATELTGIDDPTAALVELVNDATARWARLQAIEDLAEMFGEGPALEGVPTPDDLGKTREVARRSVAKVDERASDLEPSD